MVDWKKWILDLKAPSEIIRANFHKSEAPTEKFCVTCGQIGAPNEVLSGRREIELVLWSIFAAFVAVYLVNLIIGEIFANFLHFMRLVNFVHRVLKRGGELFALLSVAYSVYRISSQHQICTKCNSAAVIPVDSPRAKELLKGR